MARASESWERLVTAVLRDEDLRLTALRTPSEISSSSSSSSSPPRLFAENLQSFTYQQILQTTDGLNSSNLIKHGLSGDLFSGTLDNGTPVVVKKVDSSSLEKESIFISELEIAGKVSHSRLVSSVGHCWELMNKKFLVYDYMYSKDLSLFGGSSLLDWKRRLNTAIGVAESVSYLHHECVPPLVHRNVEASSILLEDKFEVRLGSLCDLCAEDTDKNQNAISEPRQLHKMLFMRGSKQDTSGKLKDTTRGFDVYCFGKVLLELVTGKLGFSAASHSTVTDWLAHSLAFIVPGNHKLMLDIMDPLLSTDKHVLTEIWGVSMVAKACLSVKSSKQPQMSNVLSALQYIESARFRNDACTRPSGVNVSVNLATITKILGFEMFGSSGCILRNKRISEARGKGNILRKLSHPNLVRLFIYSARYERLLIVSEASGNGSLKEHLFKASAAQLLSMEIRLKILVGAARGMAFLHANQRRGFYKCFEISDILLDKSYNTKILGFHMPGATLRNPYADVDAPAISGRICALHMEKDVYGFGIVVFDTLTGVSTHEHLAAFSTFKDEASQVVENGEVDKIMDGRLEGKYDARAARKLAALALKCTEHDLKARPTMREVVKELEQIESAMQHQKV